MQFGDIRIFEVKKGTKETLQLRLDTDSLGQIHVGDIALNDTVADPATRDKLVGEIRKRLMAPKTDSPA